MRTIDWRALESVRNQALTEAAPVPRFSAGSSPIVTSPSPPNATALPAAPAVQVALCSVPSARLGEESRATVPAPSSKCQSPEVASAVAEAASSANGYARASSIAPAK